MKLQQRRLVALVDYALQSMRARSRAVSNIADHASLILFDREAQGLAGLRLNDGGPDGDDEIWLTLAHPPAPAVPPQPDNRWLAPWLNLGRAKRSVSRLATQVDGQALISAGTHRDASEPATVLAAAPAVDPQARITLADYAFRAEVEAQYALYIESARKPWAQAEEVRKRSADLYLSLFTLQQELAGALVEGQLELVWGMGLCKATLSGSEMVYPLITRVMELVFNAQTQAAELRPRDVDPRLELDVFLKTDADALAAAQRQAGQFLLDAGESLSPFEPAGFEPLLDIARRALEVKARAVAAQDDDATRIEISNGWVVFARPRSTVIAVQDLERFRELLSTLDENSPLPGAVAALVTEPTNIAMPAVLPSFRGVTAAYHAGGAAEPVETQDLFFPKPFNDEQARIVQMLEVSNGVVVQGPPGTGKTHTIANIICHWLANGRRVLVTSMRDPALAVLREQLPVDIQPLALTLLAGEQDATNQLERSIRKIAAEVQSLDPAKASRQVDGLVEAIDALHGKLKRIDTDLGRWAKLNVSRIDLGGETIDPQDAAAEVMRNTGQFEWLPDGLGVGPQYIPRFSAEQLR